MSKLTQIFAIRRPLKEEAKALLAFMKQDAKGSEAVFAAFVLGLTILAGATSQWWNPAAQAAPVPFASCNASKDAIACAEALADKAEAKKAAPVSRKWEYKGEMPMARPAR